MSDWLLILFVPAAGALVLGLARLRDRARGVPRLLEEPPEEIHPAALALLWDGAHGRKDVRSAFRAQLLHLAREGVIELQPVGTVSAPEDFTIRRSGAPPESGPDRAFVAFLFLDRPGEAVALRSLDASAERGEHLSMWLLDLRLQAVAESARSHPVSGIFGLMRWGIGIARAFTGGPVRMGSRFRLETAVLIALASAAVMAAAFAPTRPSLLALAGASLVGARVTAALVPPRLPPGLRERVARWASFRRYLAKFSSLPDAPAMAVTIWERFLVYAVALDVAGEVEDQVRGVVAPDALALLASGDGVLPAGWARSFPVDAMSAAVAHIQPALADLQRRAIGAAGRDG